MKRIGRVVSIVGKRREICRIDAEELEVDDEDSAGM